MKKNKILIYSTVLAAIVCVAGIAYIAGIIEKKNYADGLSQQPYIEDKQSEIIKYVNYTDQSTLQSTLSNELPPETATVKDGVQEISITLEPYAYPPLIVQKGIPVKLFIVANENNLNSCNNEIVIPDYEISKTLETGENLIEFTPIETGVVSYSCWMGMINATIAVVDDINRIDTEEIQEQVDALPPVGGCCNR